MNPARLVTSVGMVAVPVVWLVAIAAGLTVLVGLAVSLGAFALVVVLLVVWSMVHRS
jgi:uncharacterized membrane protein YphA (DoxX/SURF4 family)